MTIVAGGGTNGDGGLATQASLNHPVNVVSDSAGDLFIADIYDNKIRRVDTNGIITTVAGNGLAGTYAGDGGAGRFSTPPTANIPKPTPPALA